MVEVTAPEDTVTAYDSEWRPTQPREILENPAFRVPIFNTEPSHTIVVRKVKHEDNSRQLKD